jgi:2-polyprenyl-3-methyl-5-hydroxy-6-metoxy-1,4-benzoquinol methylase
MLARALVLVSLIGCSRDRVPAPIQETKPTSPAPQRSAPPAGDHAQVDPATSSPSADLKRDQDEYVADVMAFTNTTREQVRDRMKRGSVPLKEEWEAWEKQGPMTDARITSFYKQTANYIYELGEWHLFVQNKRDSDMALVEDMRQKRPKNILDFGGGVGLAAIPLARAGFDVTLADLDSTTLRFAEFRAKRNKVPLKLWKYDVIMALDVLEHLPKEIMHDVVDKLVKLKHAKTEIILSAPFGRTSVHPMHLDLTEDTKREVERLKTELPKP